MNKVLVIDDVQTNLTLFAKVVSALPEAEAVCFTSSREALDWATINASVLIVVDQNMPELSGVEFISALRDRGNSDTPIIMITGQSDKELQRDALKRGASAFLSKPVDPVAFVSLARNLIHLRGARIDTMAKAGAAQADSSAAERALVAAEKAVLDMLAATIDIRDARTGDHCRRVALYAEAIARKLQFSVHETVLIGEAARVFDIGKIGIPDRILLKAGRLLGDERAIAKKHAPDGGAVLAAINTPLMHAAAEIARSHHERFDGSGYPSGLAGAAIPVNARVVAVADMFSAMTCARPWRSAASVGNAVESIERESGTAFEPKVVGAFRDAMPELMDIKAEIPDVPM